MIDKEMFSGILKENEIRFSEPMKDHTTFRTGGPADCFITPGSMDALISAVDICKREEIPFLVIGKGSNLLVGDKGIRGVVIKIDAPLDKTAISREGGKITVDAMAGISMMKLASYLMVEGIGGFEFASGIPGTMGGGLYMNAGAYGGELKDVVVSATCITADGDIKERTKEELDLSYRHSSLMENGDIVLSVKIELFEKDREDIKALMDDLKERRREKQPIEYPSAGSTFKRPEGYFAGKLIADSGLKGASVGGACVSEKHAGFIINKGDATSADIKALIEHVTDKVLSDTGVRLVPEVRFTGEF